MCWETVLVLEEIVAEHNPETGRDPVESQVGGASVLRGAGVVHGTGGLMC